MRVTTYVLWRITRNLGVIMENCPCLESDITFMIADWRDHQGKVSVTDVILERSKFSN